MPIKVSLTALRGPSTPDEREQLLRELAPHASRAALAVFERLWRDPASLLDDGDRLTDADLLDRVGAFADPTTQLEAVELDPALADYRPEPLTRARFDALTSPSRAVLRAIEHAVIDEKSDDEPTLRPAEALVDGQAARDVAPRTDVDVRAMDEDESRIDEPRGGAAVDEQPVSVERAEALAEPTPTEPDESARDDIPAAAGIPQTEETMAVKHEQREGGEVIPAEEFDASAPIAGADPSDEAPSAEEASGPEAASDASVSVEADSVDGDSVEAEGVESIEAEDVESVEAESVDTIEVDPAALEAGEPDGAELSAPASSPTAADGDADDDVDDFDDDGDGPSVEGTAEDLFESVPPTARRFLAFVDARGEVEMPEVMQQLGLVRAKGVGGAIEPIQRLARLIGAELPFVADFAPSGNKRWRWVAEPLADVPAEVLEAIPMPPPTPKKKKQKARGRAKRDYKKQWGKRAGHKGSGDRRGDKKGRPRPATAARDGNAPGEARTERPAARGASAPPTDRGPRRRRFDRPMPEVFRRSGRADDRPAPPRRERGESGSRSRSSERISRSMPAIERRGADRPPRGPARFEAETERTEVSRQAERADAPARSRSRSDAPVGRGRVDAPATGRVDTPAAASRAESPGRIDGPGQGRIDGPGSMRRVDVPGRIAASRAEVERRSEPVEPTASSASDEPAPRKQAHSPEERLPLPRSGVFRRRMVSDTDVPVVVIRRRKR